MCTPFRYSTLNYQMWHRYFSVTRAADQLQLTLHRKDAAIGWETTERRRVFITRWCVMCGKPQKVRDYADVQQQASFHHSPQAAFLSAVLLLASIAVWIAGGGPVVLDVSHMQTHEFFMAGWFPTMGEE